MTSAIHITRRGIDTPFMLYPFTPRPSLWAHLITPLLPSPMSSVFNADVWQQIAVYLVDRELDALWQCGDGRVHYGLFRNLKHVPPIVLKPKRYKWPCWMQYCYNTTHLHVYIPYMSTYEQKNLLYMEGGVRRPFTDTTIEQTNRPEFWRDAMRTWSTNTLQDLKLDFSITNLNAFWMACVQQIQDRTSNSSPPTSNIYMDVDMPSSTPPTQSVLGFMRSTFPRLASLRVTTSSLAFEYPEVPPTDKLLQLDDWLLSTPRSIQAENVDCNGLVVPPTALEDTAAPLYTLHLDRLAKYQSNTPLLMQHLPRTLTDLKLVFHETAELYVGLDIQQSSLSYVAWNECTAVLPRHLTRLSLKGIPFNLILASTLSQLQQLETLHLAFIDDHLAALRQLSQPTVAPFSQLPLSVRTLKLSDPSCARMIAYMKSVPANNRLTSLTLQEDAARPPYGNNTSYFGPLVECIVSDIKFQRLETLHVWIKLQWLEYENFPSLRGMEDMHWLQSVSSCFLHPMLCDQWQRHLPLSHRDGLSSPLRVVTEHSTPWPLDVDHHCAHPIIVNEVLSKLHVEAVNWCTSRSDVQLPPNLAATIRTLFVADNMTRQCWHRNHDIYERLNDASSSSTEMTTTEARRPVKLHWVQSIQHLPNLETLIVNDDCSMSRLQELTCPLKSFHLLHSFNSTYLTSVFDFERCAWATRLVDLNLQTYIETDDATRFMRSLPSTLETLCVVLIYKGDVTHLSRREYVNRHCSYASATQEERSKREITFFPPRLRSCQLNNSYIYITEAMIRSTPTSLIDLQLSFVMDVSFDPWSLLTLAPHLRNLTIKSIFCSDPRLSDKAALQAPLNALWRKAPQSMTVLLEMPMPM